MQVFHYGASLTGGRVNQPKGIRTRGWKPQGGQWVGRNCPPAPLQEIFLIFFTLHSLLWSVCDNLVCNPGLSYRQSNITVKDCHYAFDSGIITAKHTLIICNKLMQLISSCNECKCRGKPTGGLILECPDNSGGWKTPYRVQIIPWH